MREWPRDSEATFILVLSIRMSNSLILRKLEIYVLKNSNLLNSFIVSRLGSDISVVQEGLTTNVSMFIRSLLFVIVALVFVFIISWQLTLVMIASILPVLIFSVFYGNMMKRTQKIIQDNRATISNIAEETFANVRTVKAFATEADEIVRYEVGNHEVYH